MSETKPEPVNVALHLRHMARTKPNRRAVVCSAGRDASGRATYVHSTFLRLDEDSDQLARGFERIGIGRGTRTALMVRPSIEFFSLTFALFKVGAVIIMIDPGMGRRNIGKCLAESEPQAFIGIPLAQFARSLFGWGKPTLETIVTVGQNLLWGGHRLRDLYEPATEPFEMAPTEAGETAAILFTSGSTGVPKGAVYTHGIFAAQVRYLAEQFEFGEEEIDLATFPLFALFDPALGMTAVIPDMNASKPGKADPRKLIEAIQDHGVTQMFGSPALIDRLSRYGEKNLIELPTMRRALSAGAPVRDEILERFRRMLPDDALVFTPYGATEALPVAAIESREVLEQTRVETAQGKGICVGRPIPQVELRIIKITDDPIDTWSDDLIAPDDEIGEIVVKGPIVTSEYYNRPDSTRLAKINPSEGSGVYHRMGDVGRLDGEGRLWFCGRKSHRVVMPERTLFTIACEAIFNQHERVFRSALIGLGPRGRQRPVLCVELEADEIGVDRSRMIDELIELGSAHEMTSSIRDVLFFKRFPVDVRHNAKIVREKLARWAEKKLR